MDHCFLCFSLLKEEHVIDQTLTELLGSFSGQKEFTEVHMGI